MGGGLFIILLGTLTPARGRGVGESPRQGHRERCGACLTEFKFFSCMGVCGPFSSTGPRVYGVLLLLLSESSSVKDYVTPPIHRYMAFFSSGILSELHGRLDWDRYESLCSWLGHSLTPSGMQYRSVLGAV